MRYFVWSNEKIKCGGLDKRGCNTISMSIRGKQTEQNGEFNKSGSMN